MNSLYIAKNSQESKQYARLAKQNSLRRLYRGIYTDNFDDPIEALIQRHWMPIAAHIVSQGILSYRTALELVPTRLNDDIKIIFMTSTYSRQISLPGLEIKVYKGDNTQHTQPVLPELSRSNEARFILENLSQRSHAPVPRTVEEEAIDTWLAKKLQYSDENTLNQFRDEAKQVAEDLSLLPAYNRLNKKISVLLSTQENTGIIKSPYAKAVARKVPYDRARIDTFEQLASYLKKNQFVTRPYKYSQTSFRYLAFFESYFSNFIEGTEFIIDEAEDIVFAQREIHHRHADSHDVMSLFDICQDYVELADSPQSTTAFIARCQHWHARLMKARPDKRPGQFKQKANKAGNTYFVSHDDVIGTLSQAYELACSLSPGVERAFFLHYVISEVHPFDDGNGRLSRLIMNAELVAADAFKTIVPTVLRDNYLNGLRRATRDRQFYTYCKVLDQAQAYTASLPWSDYDELRARVEADMADKTADEALPIFNRILRELLRSQLEID